MWQVIGQERAVSLLQHGLEAGKLAHAYLFVGPEHVGKMTLAIALAKALNCKSDSSPCGKCMSCLRIAAGKHADVQVVQVAKNPDDEGKTKVDIGIEQIRSVLHSASLPPFEGEHRVYIFEEAERMSGDAANCLLKTLEEPPEKVLFLLLTSNENLMLPTIVSRCQRLELKRLTVEKVESALKSRNNIAPQKGQLLARLSYGCLGWAINASEDPALLQARSDRLGKLAEVLRADYFARLESAGQLEFQFKKGRESFLEMLDSWIGWWRDMLLIKTGCPDAVVNIDYLARLTEMSQSFTLLQIKSTIDTLKSTLQALRLNANPRLALEVLMLDLPKGAAKQ